MATLPGIREAASDDDGFFLTMAFVMCGMLVVGFLQFHLRGFSTFDRPLLVHAHAIVFMGWVVIYLLQNWFAVRGPIVLHRRLGWLAFGWLALMTYLGPAVTVMNVRAGTVPFFFQPLHMLVFDPMSIFGAVALFVAGVTQRARTDWHRRLNYCGMAMLTGPGLGRLLPMPLLIPWAYQTAFACTLIFPLIGVLVDYRREGRVHPAWWWGLGGFALTEALTDVISFSPIGLALYRIVTMGSPGAAIAPLAFAPSPLG